MLLVQNPIDDVNICFFLVSVWNLVYHHVYKEPNPSRPSDAYIRKYAIIASHDGLSPVFSKPIPQSMLICWLLNPKE